MLYSVSPFFTTWYSGRQSPSRYGLIAGCSTTGGSFSASGAAGFATTGGAGGFGAAVGSGVAGACGLDAAVGAGAVGAVFSGTGVPALGERSNTGALFGVDPQAASSRLAAIHAMRVLVRRGGLIMSTFPQ